MERVLCDGRYVEGVLHNGRCVERVLCNGRYVECCVMVDMWKVLCDSFIERVLCD